MFGRRPSRAGPKDGTANYKYPSGVRQSSTEGRPVAYSDSPSERWGTSISGPRPRDRSSRSTASRIA